MDTLSNKKVIVTGASGQDGSYMIDYLLENTDHYVVGAIRRTSQIIDKYLSRHYSNPRFKLVHFDLTDSHSVTTTIKNEKPDYFINFGAQTFVADSWQMPALHYQVNTMGVLHILEAIKNYAPKCRFYNAGSSEEFGDVVTVPQDETHPLRPRSPYGASKASSRHLIKVWRESYGIFAIQGYLFNHESPRRQEYFVTRKITTNVARLKAELRNGQTPTPLTLGNLSSKRDWSDSEDFVEGVWLMLNNATPKEYVLSSNETHTVREFVTLAFQAANIDGYWVGDAGSLDEKFIHMGTKQPLVVVDPKFFRPAEVDILLGDSTFARRDLGWVPKVSFQQLVKKMTESDLNNYK
jgi:GDPmannose 4,6-dehydratase